jgi:hypothetical protein
MAEVAETLLALLRSPNENTRLSACREICDRVLGKAATSVDVTTELNFGELYRRALVRVNARAVGGSGEIEKSEIQ